MQRRIVYPTQPIGVKAVDEANAEYVTVTLKLKLDRTQVSHPRSWNWNDLLDVGPDTELLSIETD